MLIESSGLRASNLLVALAAAATMAVCWTSPIAAAQEVAGVPEVVARVGGESIGRDALFEEAADVLEQVEAQRLSCVREADRNEHQALENAVDRLVRKRLFSLEAERREMTEDALREEIRTKIGEVTEAEVEAFYNENQRRINQPMMKVADQIRNYLRQQKVQQAEQDFFASIEESFEVDVLLEPLRVEVASAGAPGKGPDSAPVTIVEFSDFECPFCKRVVPTLDRIEETYGEQVRVVYRHYPLSSHPNAQKAAEASLCAHDQGKFWEMHDLLFEEQQKLQVADLKEKATRLGLDAEAFAQCLDSGRHAETVRQDFAEGSAAGVNGTPAFFVNGRFISGAVPFEDLAAVIDDEIRRKKRAE